MKIVVFAPKSHSGKIRAALAKAGAGHIGSYDCCSFASKGIGRFRGLKGAKPFLGKAGQISKVAEEKIETICPAGKAKKALQAIKEAHPYEEPAVDIYPLLNSF